MNMVLKNSKMPRRRLLTGGLVGGFGLALAGCGFRPLYGSSGVAASPEVLNALAQTRIRAIADRSGQRLRQILNDKLYSNSPAESSRYDLDIALSKQIVEVGVRPDSTTSRANLNLTATFALYDAGAQAYRDVAQSVVSYNILDDQFATVAAQTDAEDRALRQLGDEIKTRLAVYFDRRFKPRAAQR